jgi:hypothetical protein
MKPIPALPIAVLALLAAACSGSRSSAGSGGSPHAGGSAASPSAVSYSACMRSHGVPKFPDPGNDGQVPKADPQLLGISSSQLQAAQRTCQHRYPTNGGTLSANSLRQCYESGVCPPALVQQALNAGLKFAQCMRSHGLPSFPDPNPASIIWESGGGPIFPSGNGINPNSPQFTSARNACKSLMPGNAAVRGNKGGGA